MKALVIADRNPTIDLIETVKDENINLLISLGDFAREELLQLSLINSIPKIGVYMVIIVVAFTCQKLACGICIVKYGDIMAFPLEDLVDVCAINHHPTL